MSVKIFDGPIADSELANLAEMSADSLDAPTTEFKRQVVATAPMPFRPGASAAPSGDRAALTRRVERPRAKSRTGQWLLAAAIVVGLGFAGHFVGAHISAAHASVKAPVASEQPVVASTPDLVAAPVVKIVAAPPPVAADPAPIVKAKPRVRHEAPVAADPVTNEESKSPTPKADTKVGTEEAPKPAETADTDLMKQAAETLSNAQLENP